MILECGFVDLCQHLIPVKEMETNLFILKTKIMLGNKKTLRKITMAAGVVTMGMGLASAFSFEANAQSSTGASTCTLSTEGSDGHCVRLINSSGEVTGYRCDSGTNNLGSYNCNT